MHASLTDYSRPNNQKITQVPQRPVGEDDAKVEVVGCVGAVRGHAPVDDGRVGAARGVEQQPVLQRLLKSRISTHEGYFFTCVHLAVNHCVESTDTLTPYFTVV